MGCCCCCSSSSSNLECEGGTGPTTTTDMSYFKSHPPSKSTGEEEEALIDPDPKRLKGVVTPAKLNYLGGLSSGPGGGCGGGSHGDGSDDDDREEDDDDVEGGGGSGSDTRSTAENVNYLTLTTLLEQQKIQLEEHFRRELTLQVEQVMRVEEKCDLILGRVPVPVAGGSGGGESSRDVSKLRRELQTEREARLGNERYFKTSLDKLMGEVMQLGLKIKELEGRVRGNKESQRPSPSMLKATTMPQLPPVPVPEPIKVLSASALSSIQLQYGNEAAEMINDLSKEMQVNFREFGRSQQALRKDVEKIKRDVAQLSYSIEPPVEAILGLGQGPPPLTPAPTQAALPPTEVPLFNMNMASSDDLDFNFDNFAHGQGGSGSGGPRSHRSEDTMSVVELSGSEDDDDGDGDSHEDIGDDDEDDEVEVIINNNNETTTPHKLAPRSGRSFKCCNCGMEFESEAEIISHMKEEKRAALDKSCLSGRTKSESSSEKERSSSNPNLHTSSNQSVTLKTSPNQDLRISPNQTLKTSSNQESRRSSDSSENDFKSSLNIMDPQITISIVPLPRLSPSPSPPPPQPPIICMPPLKAMQTTKEETLNEAPAPSPTVVVSTPELSSPPPSSSSSSQLPEAHLPQVKASNSNTSPPSKPTPASTRSHHVTRSRTNSIPTPRKPGIHPVLSRRFLRGGHSHEALRSKASSSSNSSNFRPSRPSPTITTANAPSKVGTPPSAVKVDLNPPKGNGSSSSSSQSQPGPSSNPKSNPKWPNPIKTDGGGGTHVHHSEKNPDHGLRGEDVDEFGNPRFFCKCGKSYGAKFAVYRHIREISIQKVFTCTLCPMQYSRLCVLRRHMRNSHKVDYCQGKFACSNCGKFFANFKEVVEHRAKVHNKYK